MGPSLLSTTNIGTTRKTKEREEWTKKENVTQLAVNVVVDHLLVEAEKEAQIHEISCELGRIIIMPKQLEEKYKIEIKKESEKKQ